MPAVTEVIRDPIVIPPGWEWVNTTDDDAVLFTDHSHRDILRFVIGEIGDEVRLHVDEILRESGDD